MMSRRKQLNPKPLNKGDCSDSTEDMTVDSRDSKDFSTNNPLMEDQQHHQLVDEEERHSSPLATEVVAALSRHTMHQTDIKMQRESSPHTGVHHSPEPSDKDSDSAPPLYKRQKMELPDEDGARSPQVSSPRPEASEHLCDDFQNPSEESNSKDLRSCSTPNDRSSPPPPPSSESPNKSEDNNNSDRHSSPSPSLASSMPKLRLNALLASDPALMPDAKDLKIIHEESQTQKRKHQQQQLQHEEDMEASSNSSATITDTVIKPLAPPPAEVTAPRMKVFMCLPCGIGFSSPSTLEAHQAYYCSHRHKDTDDDPAVIGDKSSTSPSQLAAAGGSSSGNAGNAAAGGTEPAAKAPKTGKQYACTQCSYSADKKVSLNRHMRMHQTSPAPSSNASNNGSSHMEENSSQQVDRYCSDCDIRFNNVKTYRAHKQHYCSSRRTDGQLTPKLEVATAASTPKANAVHAGAISPQTRTKTPTPAMVAAAAAAAAAALQQPTATPFLALPTNPILIIPYSLIRSASLIAGPLPSPSVVNPETTCYTLDNGNLKPMATALNINAINAASSAVNNIAAAAAAAITAGQQIPIVESTRQTVSNETLLTEKNARRNVEETTETTPKRKGEGLRESAPLDLSLRRSPIAALLQRQRLNSVATNFLESEQQRIDMESLLEAGKENLSIEETGSITPEQIVCAPSLPNSPSMSPSPRRRAVSPRSSGAGSTSSMSPPATIPPSSVLSSATNPSNILDNLHLRSMLPAELLNPLLANKNLELALKLSAAAAAAAVSSSSASVATAGSTPAELAAAAVAAAAGRGSLLGLPVLPPAPSASAVSSTAGAPNQPQIYVKQGVSKCKECNIVFCKYENYLAHKQHYCSARNQEPAEGDAKVSPTPPIAAGATTAETTPVAYHQLICAACGIKYTSLDNLRAHQNYYCPKGGGAAAAAAAAVAAKTETPPAMAMPKEKCPKCKTLHEFGLPCPPPPALQQQIAAQSQPLIPAATQPSLNSASGVGNQNVYKCPLCDAVSLTATESRKHMETHGTVKAFRCTICRYKGNTLRGMRTHIRMHFDKKSGDLNEEHYMACILEDESIEIPSAAALNQEHIQAQQKHLQQQVAAAAAVAAGLQQQQQQQQQHHQQQQQQQQQSQQVFNCDICNYSSTYKGNVLRHMKLVHPHIITNSPSISPEAGDLETADTNSLSSSLNGDNGLNNFTIKSEPLDTQNAPGITVNSTALASAAHLNPHDNNNSPTPSATGHSNDMMHHIKTEPIDVTSESTAAVIMNIPPTLRSPVIGPPPPLNSTPEENINQKYCQTCDISFNYMKTYLAHKQFYCKNKMRRPEAQDTPSPNAGNVAAVAGVTSPNALMMQKNKENLQQEAAI